MAEKPIRLFDTLAGRYPEPDDVDTLRRYIRAGIAIIPMVGGSMNELLSMVLAPGVMRYRDEWFKDLANLVEELGLRVDGFKPEKLAENDQFISATIQATRIATATHQHDKRVMLRNALFNVATEKGPKEDLQQVFFNAIEEFSPSHVKLLKVLWTGRQDLSRKNLFSGVGTYQDVVERLIPELRGQQNLVECILTDLRNRGFSTLDRTNVPYGNATVITNLGIEFLHFVMDPPEEA